MVRGFRTFFGLPFTIRISGSRSSFSAKNRNHENCAIWELKSSSASRGRAWDLAGAGRRILRLYFATRGTVPAPTPEAGPSSKGEDRRVLERKEKQAAREGGCHEACTPRPARPPVRQVERAGTYPVTLGRLEVKNGEGAGRAGPGAGSVKAQGSRGILAPNVFIPPI